ncbi:MAG: DUF6502 family protein [Nitrospiria bacterium]
MTSKTNQILFSAVLKLLRPLVRIFLRNNVPYGTFADLAKRVYVTVSIEEFGIPGRKQTDSRVSIITGLTRKEVRRIKELPGLHEGDEAISQQYHRAARVVSGWVRDREFLKTDGQPADLLVEGSGATFSALVKKYSGDMPVRAMLDELLRVNSVERLENDRIRLKARAYLPDTEEGEKLTILGTEVKDLIATIDHNICSKEDRFFQRNVTYDNLPVEILERFRQLSSKQGQALLEEMDLWLAQHDRDTNPSIEGTGRKRAGISVFYFEEDHREGDQ